MRRLLFFVFFLCATITFSQEENFWSNVRFGGGLGLSFGNTTTISISPMAVYDFNEGFSLGAGINYTYTDNDFGSANIYGGNLLSMYNAPFINLQFSGEYEHLFVNQSTGDFNRNWDVPALYFGVAYRTGFASIGVRYDVLHSNTKSVYASPISPIIRVFF
ncbi:hypothetical protein P8625_01225 [Tenacibaculum tangerinum]|uniref:Alpha-ketoglutarate decarboxylase n=1 Tax=Tenacibaculum tangerinum TaxID=3038772 RepID=A0ABY8L3H5_9FLAO|nr:hypothetical protein [Tenacibaculum tangerinum]WGH75814.1 hypothetical protein P8625_01225 [Tenacibaculum tangerinum]